MRRKTWALFVATALVTTLFATAAAANPWESADLVGQQISGDPETFEDAAKIRRGDSSVNVSVTMPTPTPGSYTVPPADMFPTSSGEDGSPAAFSLWVFIFFNPEACDGACDGPDLVSNPDVVAGAFSAGGHLVDGSNLTITGGATHDEESFPKPGGESDPDTETIAEALDLGYTIAGAEIHVAVAPHGKLDASLLPAQISTPAGTPDYWWIALYDPLSD